MTNLVYYNQLIDVDHICYIKNEYEVNIFKKNGEFLIVIPHRHGKIYKTINHIKNLSKYINTNNIPHYGYYYLKDDNDINSLNVTELVKNNPTILKDKKLQKLLL